MSEPWPEGRAASVDDGAGKGLFDVGPARAGSAADRSPLLGVDYDSAAECLWRWVDAPADAVVSALATRYAGLDAAGRHALRSSLCPDDLYTLATFARRRAFAAIRTGAVAEVRAAFDALSAIELSRIDWRDIWVSSALASYAAERLALTPAEAVRDAAGRAEPELAALLGEVTADSVDLVQECGYRVLETPTGRVLVDDEGREYAPEADLPALAFEAAAMLERDDYQVGQVSVAVELPGMWLGGARSPAVDAARRLTGCACVHAGAGKDTVPADQHVLLVFLAEAASAGDAAALAEAASRQPADQAVASGVAAGRHCAVVVARSTVLGLPAIETRSTLGRFAPRLAAILHGGAGSSVTARW
ncbi:hypothetical protein I0C86_17610 [Plantactinospora sp. S1510]|uniref:Uncharacterized protein n=1 Tax=Plantactinospora alkalitolerans TaxID=2789879 RepID=A0ABS0GX32_9ACTN|nr:hypothetical protein [Plantactinospora alkalitolerans]MBF9130762.1 hypothetical protein [Plantactinospora alkalitolerans]